MPRAAHRRRDRRAGGSRSRHGTRPAAPAAPAPPPRRPVGRAARSLQPLQDRPPSRRPVGGGAAAVRTVALVAAAVVVLAALAACAAGSGDAAPRPALVFAAASLGDVLDEQAAAFREEHPGAAPELHYAGSNLLARQILHGAPADLFVSADRRQVDLLVAAGRVEPRRVVELLANRLVVVVPAGNRDRDRGRSVAPAALAGAGDLVAFPRLALADPESVPAGVYARRWLESAGVWDELAPRVVPALDVRAALAAVATGHLPAGIVYATDAAGDRRVRVVYEVPEGEGPRIRYYAAPVEAAGAEAGAGEGDGGGEGHGSAPSGEAHRLIADAFLAHLRGPRAAAIFRAHGFEVADAR